MGDTVVNHLVAKLGKYEEMGRRIKVLRQKFNLTQEMLAEKAEVSGPYITLLEAGKRLPGRETCKKLAQALGVDPNELLLAAGWAPLEDQEEKTLDEQFRKAASRLGYMLIDSQSISEIDDEEKQMFLDLIKGLGNSFEVVRHRAERKAAERKKANG
ncbi:MAG: helix-turn-helix transcriptional regulator [Patescibacteria group bacterium]|nr:helix-turn-helix transcriptional regulator [Patescibacteria group bacterium]